MHSSRQPRLLGPLLLLFLLISVALISFPRSTRAQSEPKVKVTWQPTTLEVSLLAGTSTVREAIFTSTGDLEDLSFFVTPELAPFLSVEAFGLDTVESDTPYSLLLMFGAPLSMPVGIYEGTVHIRHGNGTIPQTLKILVNTSATTSTVVPPEVSLPSRDRLVENEYGIPVAKDELIVGLSFDITDPEARIMDVASSTGGTIIGSIPNARIFQLMYPGMEFDSLEGIRLVLEEISGVEFANYHDFAASVSKGNPGVEFDQDWDEDDPDGNNWGLEYIHAPSAWDILTGTRHNNQEPVAVAVIDQDIFGTHADLIDNIDVLTGAPYVFPPYVEIELIGGHGTHTAGTICANGHNDIGIAGVMWDCSLRLYGLYPGYISWQIGSVEGDIAWKLSSVQIFQMMQSAVDDGARIVNMSLGATFDPEDCNENLVASPDNAAYRHIISNSIDQDKHKDVLWVISAGNEHVDAKCTFPAALVQDDDLSKNIISVAAIDSLGELWVVEDLFGVTSGSNFGPSVSVAAPGSDILSLTPFNRYGKKSGTSMAAPHVSGLAGLVLAKNPEFSAAKVKECIVQAAEKYGPQVPGHEFHVISAPEAVLCDFPETPTLQRIEVHGRSMSDNGRYVVHDAPERRVPQLDTNFHTDIYMYDLQDPNPGDNPVLASVSVNGIAGNLASRLRWDQLAVSDSGRVVFQSGATDLVAGDTNQVQDIFIRDFSVDPPATVQVSVRSDGTPNKTYYNMPALNPSVSIDGRYVSFESDFRYAANASYTTSDIFLRDVDGHGTYLVSQNRDDPRFGGNADSTGSLVSPNGEFVAFNSLASNIGIGVADSNGLSDVYLYDIPKGQVVERISVGNDGSEANGNSVLHSISRDGRFVLFYSTAQGLEVDGGVNSGNYYFLYLRDRDLQTTTEIDRIWNGYDLSRSRMTRISQDGRYLAFWANQWTPGHSDVLLWDRYNDELTRLSQGYDFSQDVPVEPSNGSSMIGFINNDTQVAFLSAASNLVPDDDNGEVVDIFIYTIP